MRYLLYIDNKVVDIALDQCMDVILYKKATYPPVSNKSVSVYQFDKDKLIKQKDEIVITQEYITQLKKTLSENVFKLPLYDIYSKTLFLIYKQELYWKVVRENYRFPSIQLQDKLKKTNRWDPDWDIFLSHFDLSLLENTYLLYFEDELKKQKYNITSCVRPSYVSFLKHIQPYYKEKELKQLQINMELSGISNLNELCETISKNDISYNILVEHQKYISETNNIELIKYLSFNGSYLLNKYLRNLAGNSNKNELLETVVHQLQKVIINSPLLDKDYWVYRFITRDDFLNTIKIGDIYTDSAFMSTTRNPFYTHPEYEFGFILLKIKVPKNAKLLCIESFSIFPNEEEILLPAFSQFKLTKKDEQFKYVHIDPKREEQIIRKYEFEWVGVKDIEFSPFYSLVTEIKLVTMNNLLNNQLEGSWTERIRNFIELNINENRQINFEIGDKTYLFAMESYNSTSAYSSYYYYKKEKGLSLYQYFDGITCLIELDEKGIYANYFQKYIPIKSGLPVNNDFITWMCALSFYLRVPYININGTYQSASIFKKSRSHEVYQYRKDFYDYLTSKKKRYTEIGIDPQFNYFTLDKLHNYPYYIVCKEFDQFDQIAKYNKITKLSELYIHVMENYTILVKELENKMGKLFYTMNPWKNYYYRIHSESFLYDKKLINEIHDIEVFNIQEYETKIFDNII